MGLSFPYFFNVKQIENHQLGLFMLPILLHLLHSLLVLYMNHYCPGKGGYVKYGSGINPSKSVIVCGFHESY